MSLRGICHSHGSGNLQRIPACAGMTFGLPRRPCGLLAITVLFIMIAASLTANAAEIKIGGLAHDVGTGLKQRHEKGIDLQLEYIASDIFSLFFARPHLGTTLNTQGYSSSI